MLQPEVCMQLLLHILSKYIILYVVFLDNKEDKIRTPNICYWDNLFGPYVIQEKGHFLYLQAFLPNKNGYVGMAVELPLHYCLSESMMP